MSRRAAEEGRLTAMTLTASDNEFLKGVAGVLKDRPLQPGSDYYEPIHQSLDEDDPVWLVRRQIEFGDRESLQLFSGFRGAGKSTELLRLKQDLEKEGYFVLYADALDYVNPAEPVDVSEMLMVLAGSFSDALEKDAVAVPGDPFWKRARDYLSGLDVHFTEAHLKLEVNSPAREVLGGIKAGIDLKAQIKDGSNFRTSLQRFLSTRIGEMKGQVDRFFEQAVTEIRRTHGKDKQIVFIFDQLEQLRGSYQTWQAVIRGVQELFSIHIDRLKLPYVHAVYAVPPWLKFLLPTEAPLTILPTVHLWNNDPQRTRYEPGWTKFRSLVRRRLGEQGIVRLFGPDGLADDGPVDRLIGVCGGHVRDLLRLLQSVVIRARAMPVDSHVIDAVINAARRDLLPIALEDARWLHAIGRSQDTGMPDTGEHAVERLSNFLDTHRVIYFVNGSAWYDIHPLLRDEVERLVTANPPAAET
jgi:hypothetical protein